MILTDHRILPLSWTRDAYYQALAALPTAPDSIAAHLRWLWQRCDRPGELFQRSYQANGVVKDWALQADQQLYPVLELLDYRDAAGSWPPGDDAEGWGARLGRLWAALPRDSESGLLISDENPADDATGLPLLLSTQILYWHTARRLAATGGELGLDSQDLAAEATRIGAVALDSFPVDGPFGVQWAYAIDGHGNFRLYHDANDLPVAIAPCVRFVRCRRPAVAGHDALRLLTSEPGVCRGSLRWSRFGAHSGRVATRRRAGMGMGITERRHSTRWVLSRQAGGHRRRRWAVA